MSEAPATSPDGARRADPAALEAAAARIMTMHRIQQDAESLHVARDRIASGWIMVGASALLGLVLGAMMGAIRGHAVAGALILGLLGATLALFRQRML